MQLKYALPAALTFLALESAASFEHFITREGHQLFDGDAAFRFAGIHAPELHRIENDVRGTCPHDPRGWGQYFKWPTAEEQENWIKALVRTGHKAMRIYVLSVATPYDKQCERETHILPPTTPNGPPQLNEKAMQVYDRMIALADKHNLRLILPLIDHWQWWGGREQLADFYAEDENALYDVNSKTYEAYQSIIRQVINRKNTLTGRFYHQEKAIMAWETGNELKLSNQAFVTQTAALIKGLAPKQLVVDGTYLKINQFALDDPNVDIISNHFYTVNENNNPEQVKKDLLAIAGKKAYLIGEFGLKDAASLEDIMQTAVHYELNGAKAVGAFIWGFRGHRSEGGFYWHKEYTNHYSYHLPGFPEGDSNEEQEIVDLVRTAQAQMLGQSKPPPLPIPEAPILRPIKGNLVINWMGAPVGRYYRIEQSEKAPAWQIWKRWMPWEVIGDDISDGMNEYNPAVHDLFVSEELPAGNYRFRVYAKNESGVSKPSNIEYLQVKKSQ